MQLQPWTHVQLPMFSLTSVPELRYSESKNQTLVSIAEAEGHISKWGLTEGQYDVSTDHPGQNWNQPDD